MDEGSAEKISDAIFNLIPEGKGERLKIQPLENDLRALNKRNFLSCIKREVTRLKELFQNWDTLDEEEKLFIDTQIEKWDSPAHVQLYKTVKKALNRWGKVQDTEGAPGCNPGWFTFSCDAQLEEELINVLQTIENLLKKTKKNSKPNYYHLSSMTEELTSGGGNLPEVPPSSPDSESNDFLFINSPEKQRSEPLKTCGRSLSLHSGRKLYHNCHSVKSAPLIKDGYNTD